MAWGNPSATAGAPSGGTFAAISAGGNQCLAIRGDGSIAWWGDDRYGCGLANVYRFWSPVTGKHFYTTSEDEKNLLVNEYSNTWVFEGLAFRATTAAPLPGLSPVHKFWVFYAYE